MMREDVQFKIKLDDRLAKKFRKRLDKTMGIKSETDPGDTLTVTYDLFIDYFGEVYTNLQLISDMADAGAIVTGDLVRVNGGTVLIKKVIESLFKIRENIR